MDFALFCLRALRFSHMVQSNKAKIASIVCILIPLILSVIYLYGCRSCRNTLLITNVYHFQSYPVYKVVSKHGKIKRDFFKWSLAWRKTFCKRKAGAAFGLDETNSAIRHVLTFYSKLICILFSFTVKKCVFSWLIGLYEILWWVLLHSQRVRHLLHTPLPEAGIIIREPH